jgi:hypothetical protein
MKQVVTFGLVGVGVFMVLTAFAGNPILKDTEPGFLYAADPSAEVFDGKVYVYCSHDQPDAKGYSSMQDYMILESSDMEHWVNHGVVLKPRTAAGFEYADGQMNAPDCAYKDGWYYWYFPYNKTYIGVAKSRSPTGPWETAVSTNITAIFDPTVFVDDDGQAYIYGNDPKVNIGAPGPHIMGAKLKDNMVELDGDWHRLSEATVAEAVTVFKRKGVYYFMARKAWDETVYYMADNPLPYPGNPDSPAAPVHNDPKSGYASLMGSITSEAVTAPAHMSAIEFKDQWYFFYHRGDVNHGSNCRRSACFDPMTFRDDGTIEPIVYTLDEGVTRTVPPPKKAAKNADPATPAAVADVDLEAGCLKREAEAFSGQSGTKVEDQRDGGQSRGLGYITNGDWTSYEQIDFGNDPGAKIPFSVRVSAQNQGGTIELRLDSPTGAVIGTIPVASTGAWNTYQTLSTPLTGISGTHTLYLCYTGGSGNLMNLNWFAWALPAETKAPLLF